MKRVALVWMAVIGVLVASAAPAAAHASLVVTEPASGAALATPLDAITLGFNEPVEVALGGIRVYDADGDRVVTSKPTRPAGAATRIAVELPVLDDGSYVVTWRVVSADAHSIHGAFTFHVGAASPGGADTGALAQRLLRADDASAAVGVLGGVARFATFVGLVLLVGGAAFLVVFRPWGSRRLPWLGLGACALGTVAGIGLHGAAGAGLGLGAVVDAGVLADVVTTRYGTIALARLGLLALAAVWLATSPPLSATNARSSARSWPKAGVGVGVVIGLGLLATPGLAGHAAVGDLAAVAMVADVAHLAAISVWLGGLAVLVTSVLPRATGDDATTVVDRFSNVALRAVVVIVVTGTFQGWRQVETVPALTSTDYGRLLLVKVGLFLLLVAVASAGRRWVRQRHAGRPRSVSTLRRSVAGEVAVAIAILAVTAALVDATPAKAALARPFSTELTTPKLLIDVTLDPAKAGPVALHVYTLTPAGEQRPVEELTARLTLDEPPVGPITVPLTVAGPGHFAAYGFDLPLPGRWRLDVTARLTDIDQVRASTMISVR